MTKFPRPWSSDEHLVLDATGRVILDCAAIAVGTERKDACELAEMIVDAVNAINMERDR